LDDVLFSIKNINKDGEFVLEAVNGICPKQAEQICLDLTDPDSCRLDLGLGFVSGLQEAITYVSKENGYEKSIQEASDELQYLTSHTYVLTDDLKQMNTALLAVMVVSIALSVICVCIVAGMGFNVPEVIRCFQRTFTYPLFVILVLFSFVLSIAFMIASLVFADTCYGDPGPKIAAIVESSYSGSSDMMSNIMLRVFEGQCYAELNLLLVIFLKRSRNCHPLVFVKVVRRLPCHFTQTWIF
jgi:ABC-type multidrug transport system permease subunit